MQLTATTSRCGRERHASFALAEDGGWAVALDLDLDDDLRREGLARELVRALNELRKERRPGDRRPGAADPPPGRIGRRGTGRARAWIAGEVLAVSIEEERADALGEEAGGQRLVVDGEELWVMIQRT